MGNIEHRPCQGTRRCAGLFAVPILELLSAWFADPDIYFWWGGQPIDRDQVQADYTGDRSPDVESFIVEAQGTPVGYLRYWRASEGSAGSTCSLYRRPVGVD